jgi:hypothetical protein
VAHLKALQRGQPWVNEDGTPTDTFAELIEDAIQEINSMTANTQLFNVMPTDTSIVTAYTDPTSDKGGQGTVISKFSASGTGTYNVYLGLTFVSSNLIISGEAATNDGLAPSSLIDQLIPPGHSIFIQASAANAIVFLASGNDRR